MELPPEIVTEIIIRLPVGEMLPYTRHLPRIAILEIAHINDLPVPLPNMSMREQVLDLIKSSDLPIRKRMEIAARRGDISTVRRMIDLGVVDYARAMESAVRGDHVEVVELLLSLSGDNTYDKAMALAAQNGRVEIVKLMLSHVIPTGSHASRSTRASTSHGGAVDYNRAMALASREGHIEVVKLMLSHVIPTGSHRGAVDRNRAMTLAAQYGRLKMVKLLLAHNANNYNYNSAMAYAALGGHLKIVKLMLAHNANNYDESIIAAARGGHQAIIDLLSNCVR